MKSVLILLCVWLAVLLPGRAAAAILFTDGAHVVHRTISRPGGSYMQDVDLNMDGVMDFYIGHNIGNSARLNPFLGTEHQVLALQAPPLIGRNRSLPCKQVI